MLRRSTAAVPADRRLARQSRASGWRRRLFILLPGLAAIGLVITLVTSNEPVFDRLRNIVFDAYQRIAPREEAGASLAVLDIDEASIAAIGQWPWPRTTMARLVDRLIADGAATVAFDVAFPEPDRTSPSAMLTTLQQAGAKVNLPPGIELDNDAVLAKAFIGNPIVAGFPISNETTAPLPPPKAGFSFGGADPKTYLPAYSGGVADLPVLNEAAAGLGFFSFPLSADGVVRSLPVIASAQGNLYPALSVEALRVAQGSGSFIVRSTGASGEADTGEAAMTAFKDGALSMPTGPLGEFRIYYSGLKSMPTISARDLLADPAPAGLADQIGGRIVLVGTSAVGLRDLVATPFGSAVAGVRVHAEIIDQIVGQVFLDRPDWTFGAEIALAVVLGLIVLALELAGGAIASGLGTIVLIAGAGGLSWWAFRDQHLLLDPIVPAAAALVALAATTPLLLLWTDREKRFIRSAFGRYLSPELVGRLSSNPSGLTLGGELRELTILFSDIRDFTSISEKLTPDELTSLLNNFLTPATDVLLRSEATIDKYVGDAIVAFWNAPLDIADHRRKACLGALGVLAALDELNKTSGRDLRIGIGLNSAVCCVGNFGSAQRFSYSAIGDGMNLASRVESITKQYRVSILATEDTRIGAADLAFLEVDRVRVKGRATPVPIFTLLGDVDYARSETFRALTEAQHRFLDAYRALDFQAAEEALSAAKALAPSGIEGLFDVFATRLVMMRMDPPAADWDGVFIAKEK